MSKPPAMLARVLAAAVLAATAPAAFAGAAAAQGAPRASAHYTIEVETVNAGGARLTGGSYTVDAAVGEVGGVASAAGTVAKAGFAGRLYDIVGVQVAASPAALDEGAQTLLTATAALDDGTALSLAPSAVSWSVVSGPVSAISVEGVATAENVVATVGATVRGSFGGKFGDLELAVLNLGNDDLGLYGGDGVPDSWQVFYFGPNNPLGAGGADADGDGNFNRLEYAAGTDPVVKTSFFSWRVERVPGQPRQFRVVFSPRLPDRTYTVQSSATLAGDGWGAIAGALQSDSGAERTVTDPNDAGLPRKFYRVEISAP